MSDLKIFNGGQKSTWCPGCGDFGIQALEHAYGVLREKGSSDTLAPDLYSFDKFCRLVGFEHIWEFDKRWAEGDV